MQPRSVFIEVAAGVSGFKWSIDSEVERSVRRPRVVPLGAMNFSSLSFFFLLTLLSVLLEKEEEVDRNQVDRHFPEVKSLTAYAPQRR